MNELENVLVTFTCICIGTMVAVGWLLQKYYTVVTDEIISGYVPRDY